ncbi:hypothetical protein ACJX0J_036598, partial [Zea mays]
AWGRKIWQLSSSDVYNTNNIGNAETENPLIITENRHMKIMSYSTEQYIFHEKKKLQIEILAHAVMSYKKIMSYSTEQYIFHEKKETPNQNRNPIMSYSTEQYIFHTAHLVPVKKKETPNRNHGGQPEMQTNTTKITSLTIIETTSGGDFLAVRFLLRLSSFGSNRTNIHKRSQDQYYLNLQLSHEYLHVCIHMKQSTQGPHLYTVMVLHEQGRLP